MTEELKGKLGLDTTDLKAGLAAANREIRVIESGFRASAAALGDWAGSATGLESRIKALTGEIGIQQLKVNALAEEYARIAAEKGNTSKAAQDLQIKLNGETEKLNKMQTELQGTEQSLDKMGSESDQTGGQVDQLASAEEKATEKGRAMDSVMSGLGTALGVAAGAIAALGAAAIGAAGALGGMVLKAADAAGELTDLSNKTGVSTTKLQEMAFVGGQIGVSTETMAGALSRLTRSMSSAQTGSGDAALAFRQLGVNVKDSNGNLRDSEAVFQDTLTALGGIQNETERDAMAMKIFGKSAQELNPLIKTSAAEMEIMKRNAFDLGAVVSEQDVAALDNFGDTLDGLKAGLQGTAMSLAADLLPAFQGLATGAEGYLKQLSTIVKSSDGDMGKLASGLGGLLGKIATDIAAQAPKMLNAGLAIVQGLLDAILTALPVLIPAAVGIITSLVNFLVTNLPLIIEAGIQLVLALVNGILPMLPMLIEAALQMMITLALGVAQALPVLIPTIVEIIPKIVLTLLENLPLLIQAALQLIVALATGLVEAIPILIPYVPMIIQAIFDTLIITLPLIANAAAQLVITLVNGIVANFPLIVTAATQTMTTYQTGMIALFQTIYQTAIQMVVNIYNGIIDSLNKIVEAAKKLIDTIVNTITSLKNKLLDIGKAIVEGVWAGIVAMKDWFWDKVLHYFEELIDRVKEYLNIHSPSGVFADIGENMALGLGEGFADAFTGVRDDVLGLVAGLTDINANINANALALTGENTSGQTTIYISVNAALGDSLDVRQMALTLIDEIRRNL
jgi:phage-related protein